jgi:hypothetical protein
MQLGDRVAPMGLAMTTTCHCEAKMAEAIPKYPLDFFRRLSYIL